MAVRANDVYLVQDLLQRGASRNTGGKVRHSEFTAIHLALLKSLFVFVDRTPVGRIHQTVLFQSHAAFVATGLGNPTR